MITSCSPGWVTYLEKHHPELIDHLSTAKSPQAMFGAVAKTYYAQKMGWDPHDVVSVSVMPCTAKKYEASRPELGRDGYQDVDYVLTTRELAKLIRYVGLDLSVLPRVSLTPPWHRLRRRRHLRRYRRRYGGRPAHRLRALHRQDPAPAGV